MQKTLDLSIKKAETGSICGGYSVNGKEYPSYVDNNSWLNFVADMKENYKEAFERYGKGSGDELGLKKISRFPPKMASYGSSSRMIYNSSRDIDGFRFEYKLPTSVGGISNMDGFLEKNDKLVFIEAKCREPYASKPHKVEKKYKDLYLYLDNDDSVNLNIVTTEDSGKLNVSYMINKVEILRFDIKQTICHLLGIATEVLKHPTDKKILFVYYVFNPKLVEIVDCDKKNSIITTYEEMCEECNSIDFKKLFAKIIRYLKYECYVGCANDDEIDEMISNFKFVLCDQKDYLDVIL